MELVLDFYGFPKTKVPEGFNAKALRLIGMIDRKCIPVPGVEIKAQEFGYIYRDNKRQEAPGKQQYWVYGAVGRPCVYHVGNVVLDVEKQEITVDILDHLQEPMSRQLNRIVLELQ